MLLTSLKFEHYRGIKALELSLGPTTVLVGENNCGKTTVLHALRACLAQGAVSVSFRDGRVGVRGRSLREQDSLNWTPSGSKQRKPGLHGV